MFASDKIPPRDMELGDEGILEGLVGRETWKFAWARSIAKAWEDEAFEHKLLTNSSEAFKEFGFNTPPGLTINVQKYEGGKAYDPQPGVNGWKHIFEDLAGEVTVILPPKPESSERALALADYNATGLAYPFTT